MISEKMMEDAISSDPERYLGEKGLRLIARQYNIGSYVFDLLFEDRHGARLIVELQKGTLDRNHTYKILDYYDEYKEINPNAFIELMVIANKMPRERRKRLESKGISWKEILESEFSHITVPDLDKDNYDVKMVKREVNNMAKVSGRSRSLLIPDIYDKIGRILKDMWAERGTATTFTTHEIYELYLKRYPDDEEFMAKRGGASLKGYLNGMVSDYSKHAADGSPERPRLVHMAPYTYRFFV